MKRNLIISLTLLLSIVFLSESNAQLTRSTAKVGTTVAQFLKIGAGARAIGMGGTYAGISDDIYAVYWNPAGIARTTGAGQVAFNHANWLADISYDFAAASLNIEGLGTMFATFTSLGVPEDKVRTFEFPEGDGRVWDAKSLAIGLGFARMLTDRFAIGFHFKYLHEGIWNTSANGFAIDIGTYYITPFNDMIIGASISNFGTKMQLDGRDILFNYDPDNNPDTGPNNVLSKYEMGNFDLPLTFRLGLAMDVIKYSSFRVTTALDAVHPNDNTEYLNGGLEVAYDEMIALRVGYKSFLLRDTEQGLTFGGGINYQVAPGFSIMINYGWADFNRLENVQFVDLGIKF
ncbi:MAG TPA: PorV/PorQ family protein [Ignavibacteriaceae bacterium]|nr:PorV/PorQ family protein [Ignavibacteriaceae bacterium]